MTASAATNPKSAPREPLPWGAALRIVFGWAPLAFFSAIFLQLPTGDEGIHTIGKEALSALIPGAIVFVTAVAVEIFFWRRRASDRRGLGTILIVFAALIVGAALSRGIWSLAEAAFISE